MHLVEYLIPTEPQEQVPNDGDIMDTPRGLCPYLPIMASIILSLTDYDNISTTTF